MTKILSSASKIVFIMLAVTVCTGFFFGKLESKDFMVLAISAFTFYYANKGTNDPSDTYLGK
jgi:NADH:ubiquinone oxidoreductase subunit 2 (subunit N)